MPVGQNSERVVSGGGVVACAVMRRVVRGGVRVGTHLGKGRLLVALSRPTRLEKSGLPAVEGRRTSGESVRTSARRADPRGQRRGVRRAARQAAASRSVPSRKRDEECGGLGVAGGRREERSPGTAGRGRQKPQQAANPPSPRFGRNPSRTRAHPNLESATPHHQFARLPESENVVLYNIMAFLSASGRRANSM